MNESSVGKALAFPTSKNEAMRAFGVPDSILRDVRPSFPYLVDVADNGPVPRAIKTLLCHTRYYRPILRRP